MPLTDVSLGAVSLVAGAALFSVHMRHSARKASDAKARAKRVKKQKYAKAEPLAARKKDFLRRLVKKTREDHAAKVDKNYIAPFSPSPDAMVTLVLDRIKPTEADVVFDLGCGDARWLITASKKYRCACVGIELDSTLVGKAQHSVAQEKLEHLVKVKEGDVYGADITTATVVVVYAFAKAIERIKEMLTSQLQPGSRIISVGFQIKGWTSEWAERVGHLKVYLYIAPKQLQQLATVTKCAIPFCGGTFSKWIG